MPSHQQILYLQIPDSFRYVQVNFVFELLHVQINE
jgi:hypothetical protein